MNLPKSKSVPESEGPNHFGPSANRREKNFNSPAMARTRRWVSRVIEAVMDHAENNTAQAEVPRRAGSGRRRQAENLNRRTG
jgi:hypothetical protein